MRLIFIALLLSGCSMQVQLGTTTDQKIEAQLSPIYQALREHSQVINNQATLLKKLTPEKEK